VDFRLVRVSNCTVRVVDVHVFHAQGAAVGGLELVEYHAECDFLFHGGEFFRVAFVATRVCSTEVERRSMSF